MVQTSSGHRPNGILLVLTSASSECSARCGAAFCISWVPLCTLVYICIALRICMLAPVKSTSVSLVFEYFVPIAEAVSLNQVIPWNDVSFMCERICSSWNFLSESKQFGYVLDSKKRHKMEKRVGLNFKSIPPPLSVLWPLVAIPVSLLQRKVE